MSDSVTPEVVAEPQKDERKEDERIGNQIMFLTDWLEPLSRRINAAMALISMPNGPSDGERLSDEEQSALEGIINGAHEQLNEFEGLCMNISAWYRRQFPIVADADDDQDDADDEIKELEARARAFEIISKLPPKARTIALDALTDKGEPRYAATDIVIHVGDKTDCPPDVMIEHVTRLLTVATGEAVQS